MPRLAIALLLLLLSLTSAMAQERRIALVIGNTGYQHMRALPNAVNDAEALAVTLRGLGFAVTLERNQNAAAMRRTMRDFSDAARGADVALFFFAGHGLQMGTRDRAENYLVPVDARLSDARDTEDETIALSRVLQLLDGARARVVILDACRDNPLLAQMAQAGGTRSVSRGLAPIEASGAQGTLVAFSTAPGAVAEDGRGRNSPFTTALLRHLPTPGLELRGALTRVRAEVARETNNTQVPWSNDGLLAELFLAGRGNASPPSAAGPQIALAPQAAPPAPAALELAFWQSIQGSQRAEEFEAYLRQFPQGTFSDLARARIAALRAPPPPAPQPQPAVGVWPQGSGYPVPVGQAFRDCPECPEMMVIPAGSFMMGSPVNEPNHVSWEGPQRRVSLNAALAVGRFEVTFAEWDACVAAGGCSHRPDEHVWGRGNRPVINVSWNDAQQYVVWLSRRTGRRYRLLTEAEWEYAARAGTTTPYFTGTSISMAQANFGNNVGRTQPVGSYAANRFGLHDMAGNVDEWVEDCWVSSYAGASLDASRAVTGGACSSRVLRGGSWVSSFPNGPRSANRDGNAPRNRNIRSGFRVARTPGG